MKCTKCGTEMKPLNNATILDNNSVMAHFRCESCWTTHSYIFSQPYLAATCLDEPRLIPMSGSCYEDYKYFKCSTANTDRYTLVAKRELATRERLEAMGFKVEEPDNSLPAYRLYELK